MRQYLFVVFDRFKELGQLFRRDTSLAGVILSPPVQLLGNQLQFSLRMTLKLRVVLRMAFRPLIVHERICGSCIEWIVANGHFGVLDGRISESFTPVIQVMNLDASPQANLRGSPSRGWQGEDVELLVVGNDAVKPHATAKKTVVHGSAGALPERGVINRVIDFVCVFDKTLVEFLQRPDGLTFRIDAFGHLPHLTGDLSVALQIVDQLFVGCAEEAFASGPESGLRRWTAFLCAFVASEQTFEVATLELSAAVNNNGLRKTGMSAHAFPENHHAGTIARRVERHIYRQDSPGEGIRHQSEPRPAEWATRLRTNGPHIHLRVVDVNDLERTIAMPRCALFEFPIEWVKLICGAGAFSL